MEGSFFPKEEKREQKREEQISYRPKTQMKEKKKNNRSKMSSSLHTAMEDVKNKREQSEDTFIVRMNANYYSFKKVKGLK